MAVESKFVASRPQLKSEWRMLICDICGHTETLKGEMDKHFEEEHPYVRH